MIPGELTSPTAVNLQTARASGTKPLQFLADEVRVNHTAPWTLLLWCMSPLLARSVIALPEILNELKSRGYKIVHVVPAAADRPKTATSAQQWVARQTPEQHTSPSQMRPLRQGIFRGHWQEPEAQ